MPVNLKCRNDQIRAKRAEIKMKQENIVYNLVNPREARKFVDPPFLSVDIFFDPPIFSNPPHQSIYEQSLRLLENRIQRRLPPCDCNCILLFESHCL